jgi:DNA-binding transcriptional ArsR family regulator
MAVAGFIGAGDDRLFARLAARLDPELQGALNHPVRREVLRSLNRGGRPSDFAEVAIDLPGFPRNQLRYHLAVLRQSGAIAAIGVSPELSHPRFTSQVRDDERVRAVLRATEARDREQREAMTAASVSPVLTMFRVPRPVHTIRLRSQRNTEAERER